MDTWQFFQNDKGEWCWKHVAEDGFTLEGKKCFMSRTDCIADAMRNGYLARTARTHRYEAAAPAPWRAASPRS